MKTFGIVACAVSGAVGASAGYYLPCKVSVGFALGGLALALGAADFVIRDSLKLIDDRIKLEIQDVKTAYRAVPPLESLRKNLMRLNLVAMVCKGIAVAAGGLATQGKATPIVMSIGCAALAFGAVLSCVIWVSHERLQTRANTDAIEREETKAAGSAVKGLGTVSEAPQLPDRPIIGGPAKDSRRPKK